MWINCTWLARSPFLSPVHIFLRVFLRELIYERPICSQEESIGIIVAVERYAQDTSDMFEKVCHSMQRRSNMRLQAPSKNIEHLLH